MRMDPDYQLYYINWTRTTLTALVPFVLLAVLNGRIICQIRKAEKITAQMVRTLLDQYPSIHFANAVRTDSTYVICMYANCLLWS